MGHHQLQVCRLWMALTCEQNYLGLFICALGFGENSACNSTAITLSLILWSILCCHQTFVFSRLSFDFNMSHELVIDYIMLRLKIRSVFPMLCDTDVIFSNALLSAFKLSSTVCFFNDTFLSLFFFLFLIFCFTVVFCFILH